MKDVLIQFYKEPNLVSLDWLDGEDLIENRKRHGFSVNNLTEGFFISSDKMSPFFDLYLFTHDEKDYSICDFLDKDGTLFSFAVRGETLKLELIQKLMSLAKDMIITQKYLSELYKD